MKQRIALLISYLTLFFLVQGLSAQGSFIVVLDPGHGGGDPGAVGTNKTREKDINLSVALLLGEHIEKNHKDVKIVYTRKTDMDVSLPRRSQIANNAKADLFISIHTNSTSKGGHIHGAEVFTYGKAKSNANLEVVKRENEIVFLEDEYKGLPESELFGPIESAIIFEAMQASFLEHSFDLASMIQTRLVGNAKRKDRGVKSDNFSVLRNASMPSVLIELDFISCPDAEKYMKSKDGQKKLAKCLYDGFAEYKKRHDLLQKKTVSGTTTTKETTSKNNTTPSGTIYKVQIAVSDKLLKKKDLKGHTAAHYTEDGLYKYTIGESSNWNEINNLKKSLQKDFKDAFIVTFKDGVKVKK